MASAETGCNGDFKAAYGADYYLNPDGTPKDGFGYDAHRSVKRAKAMLDAAEVPPGGRVLDYGCGLGTLTAAFCEAGCDAIGVDSSPSAIGNALPQARGRVHLLGEKGLNRFDDGEFDLVVVKDVLEHVPKDEVPGLVHDLGRVSRNQLIIIPVTDDAGNFVFEPYDSDPTHVTRLTADAWPNLIARSGMTVRTRPDLTPKIRRPDKVQGTISVLAA